jgi:hypothetical protein
LAGWVVPLAAGVLVFAALFFGLRAVRATNDRPAPTQYDEASRQAFLTACGQGAGAGSAPVCSCAYERLIATVPYARYVELEAEVRSRRPAVSAPRGTPAGSNPSGTASDEVVPDALSSILVDCVAYNRQLGAPPDTGGPSGTGPATTSKGTLALTPS